MTNWLDFARRRAPWILAAFLSLTFCTFRYFPGLSFVYELWFIVCAFYLSVGYWVWNRVEGRKVPAFEWYVLALILLTPLLGAIAAALAFGQPVIYGVLASRKIAVLAAVLFYAQALRKGVFTIRQTTVALLILGWLTLVMNLCMRVFLNPVNFADQYGVGFISGAGDTAYFRLPSQFIDFNVLYYGFRGFRTGRIINYLFCLLLLTDLFAGTGNRARMLALLGAYLFLLIRWASSRRILSLLPKLLLGFGALIALSYVVMPEAVVSRFESFQDAFTVALTGEAVADPSATARIGEVLFALPGILGHPIIGNGAISYQWQGGAESILGTYFYPDDIGLYGVLWQFGIIGLILYAGQFWFALQAMRSMPSRLYTPTVDAALGYCLFILLSSLTTGAFVYDAEVSLLFIVILRKCTQDFGLHAPKSKPLLGLSRTESWPRRDKVRHGAIAG